MFGPWPLSQSRPHFFCYKYSPSGSANSNHHQPRGTCRVVPKCLLINHLGERNIMGGNNNRQRKSSTTIMSIFNIFRSSRKEEYYYSSNEGTSMGWTKVWRSDEDRGQWGAAEPGIDEKAGDFIARYKKKVTESDVHHLPPQLE